jgi:hypothetical protein
MSDSKDVKKGGFGEFAETYRLRWAARHPDAGRTQPPASSPEPILPAQPSTGPDSKE